MARDAARVFVALGSNMGDRLATLRTAVLALDKLSTGPLGAEKGGEVAPSGLRCSSFYETEPMGPQDQPDYINAVCELHCVLTPLALLDALQAIEQSAGRAPLAERRRWGARPLDLDLLLYNEDIIDEPRLTVPHPGIAQRSFVLWPLLELANDLSIPGLGPARALQADCPELGIRRLADTHD